MKTFNKLLGIGLLAILLILTAHTTSKAQGDYISNQSFYDNLQPYGTWLNDPQYGNVWVPDAEDGFRPYASRGHWVLTDYGNTWVSDYPWGWATFHYGRWRYDDYYGWEWIPGNEWAPAWVSWRHGGGYYGWAPLLPGISISLSFGRGNRVPDSYWVCAPQAYINRPNIYNYYVPAGRSGNIIRNTTVINNTYVHNNRTYIAGPRAQEIRQSTHQNVKVYTINNANRPGNERVTNNAVNIYRPAIKQATGARPARVVDATAYKQQNPNQAIANHGAGGAAFNHTNAARLATTAKTTNPDAKVVHVNPINKPNNTQPNNRPGQPAVIKQTQPGNNSRQQQAQKQATRQAQKQQATGQAQQQRQQQQRQQQQQQQPQQQHQQQQPQQQHQQQQPQQQHQQQQPQQQRQQQQPQQQRQQQQPQQQRQQQPQQQRQQPPQQRQQEQKKQNPPL